MATPADQLLKSRFEIGEQIGQGGFARVYRAKEKTTGRKVALKVLKESYLTDKEIVERFRREAFAIASISSPHVVALHDFGISGSEVFLAMEFVEGPTLRQVMHERAWSSAEIHLICGQIAQALSVAHKQNIIHRDLKPENVMLVSNPDGTRRVKVLDFGLAKLHELEKELGLEPLTRAGMCFGTPQYMSPEQIRGKAVDLSGDLYALGIIMYEMLTGFLPWDGPDSVEVMQAVIKEPVPLIVKMHPSVTRIKEVNKFMQRVLAKDKKDRPTDASEFFREFELALFGGRKPPAPGAEKMASEEMAFASVFAASIDLEGTGAHEDQTVVELGPPKSFGQTPGAGSRSWQRQRQRLESKWVQNLDFDDTDGDAAERQQAQTVISLPPKGVTPASETTRGKALPSGAQPIEPYPDHAQVTVPMARIEEISGGTDLIAKTEPDRFIPPWVLAALLVAIAIGGLVGYLFGRAH